MNTKLGPTTGHKSEEYLVDIILKAIPVAMGVSVIVTSLLGELDMSAGFSMLDKLLHAICFKEDAYLYTSYKILLLYNKN